jgi:hypothetical protein
MKERAGQLARNFLMEQLMSWSHHHSGSVALRIFHYLLLLGSVVGLETCL